MINRIRVLINRIRGDKPDMDTNNNEPLYSDIKKPRCTRCGGPMMEVNARTHQMACADSMCR